MESMFFGNTALDISGESPWHSSQKQPREAEVALQIVGPVFLPGRSTIEHHIVSWPAAADTRMVRFCGQDFCAPSLLALDGASPTASEVETFCLLVQKLDQLVEEAMEEGQPRTGCTYMPDGCKAALWQLCNLVGLQARFMPSYERPGEGFDVCLLL